MTDVTPPLDEFLAEYEADDNVWWMTNCGHHMNLFDAAVDERDEARAALDRVRALHKKRLVVGGSGRFGELEYACGTCGISWPCPTLAALDGGTR